MQILINFIMKNYIFTILFLSLIFLNKVHSQGCSDAGICTLTFAKNNDSTSVKKNAVEIGYVYGKGFEGVSYNNGFVTYSRFFNEKWNISAKVTYNQASGDFGTRGQFGDVFIVSNYFYKTRNQHILKPLAGFKIPFTAGNLKINDKPLPMDYQASLGTFDLLLGFDYQYKKWNFDTALQIPILQTNKNSYFDELSDSNQFPTTNLFERKSDVLLRATYTLQTKNNKWSFKPNIIAIYHLGNDTYENILGQRKTIENSEGLTINAGVISNYNFNLSNSLQLNVATPLVVRDIRPDGLTREFVLSFAYQYKF